MPPHFLARTFTHTPYVALADDLPGRPALIRTSRGSEMPCTAPGELQLEQAQRAAREETDSP